MDFMNYYDADEFYIEEYKISSQQELDKLKAHLDYDEDDETLLQLGNVYVAIMFDENDNFETAEVIDAESYTWDLTSPDEVAEIFGEEYLKPYQGV